MLIWLKNTGQIPNTLSTLRLLLAWLPGFFYNRKMPRAAVSAFVVIVATDKLDGYLARKWNHITKFGCVIDPLADKGLIAISLASIAQANPKRSRFRYLLIATVLREILVTILRAIKGRRGNLVISANHDGKLKMALQSAAVASALVNDQRALTLAEALLAGSMYYGVKSGVSYIKA